MHRHIRDLVISTFAYGLLLVFAISADRAEADCLTADCLSVPVRSDNVRVGYTQFPPFSRTSETGVAEGYVIELIRLLLEPEGYSISFVPFGNPAEMLDGLSGGQIDMTTLLVDNPARREFGAFTDYAGQFEIGVFVADDTQVPGTPDDLLGLRVGATDGSIGFRLASGVEGLTVVPLESGYNNVFPLLVGEIDAVSAPVESIRHLAKISGVSHRIHQAEFSLSKGDAAFLVDRNATELLDVLNGSIASAIRQGHVEQLYAEWFAPSGVPITSREQLVVGASVVFALALLGYWLRLHYVVLKRAKRLEARAELLRETLDATGLALVIFDHDMRPEYWNATLERQHPNQVPLLRRGENMRTLLALGHENGSFGEEKTAEESAVIADTFVEKVRSGAKVVLVYRTLTGETIRRSTQMLPNGQFASIGSDVSELLEAQERLEAARADLEGANIMLTDFNRLAAHDLIAPLRNVRHLHEWIRDDLLEAGVQFDQETLENFDSIEGLLKRQTRMIEDLLTYSASSKSERVEAFDPTERFSAVLDLSEPREGFTVMFPKETPRILASPVAFDVVLRNLISNAIKHHDRDVGTVEVSAKVEHNCCVFEVTDDGPGIPEAALAEVFEPFVRLRSQDNGAGTGLGLALIKRRVSEWGGSVTALSKDGQRGTTFRFTVPLAPTDVRLLDEAG